MWGGGVGGDNWVINIFGATNCERHKRETTLGGVCVCVCLGACNPHTGNVLKVIVALISVSLHPKYIVHALNMGRVWENVVRISPVKMTVKRKYWNTWFVSIPKSAGGGGGDIRYSVPLTAKLTPMLHSKQWWRIWCLSKDTSTCHIWRDTSWNVDKISCMLIRYVTRVCVCVCVRAHTQGIKSFQTRIYQPAIMTIRLPTHFYREYSVNAVHPKRTSACRLDTYSVCLIYILYV